ncbi:MAG: hypothetical protein VX741_14305, partial [Pseudomonadota bacterium]|nr:hypothetical protein [Pseudomonadota bacterium]
DHLPVFDWSAGRADPMMEAVHPFLDHPPNAGILTSASPGVRRGRVVVYDGGAEKNEPAEDRPAKSS